MVSETAQSGKPEQQQERADRDPWGLVLRNYLRCVHLGAFFDIARKPTIRNVDIIVCFTDIRGFTDYCKNLQGRSLNAALESFLTQYFQIYPVALLKTLWAMEPDEAKEELGIDEETARLRDMIVPKTFKNLGDGMMLVWEIPPTFSPRMKGRATHAVLDMIFRIFRRFDEDFHQLGPVESDTYTEAVKTLRMGAGVARGSALRLDFDRLGVDYVGSVLNLAARLQEKARPDGIVCQYDFSPYALNALVEKQIATLETFADLKGLGTERAVFIRKLPGSQAQNETELSKEPSASTETGGISPEQDVS